MHRVNLLYSLTIAAALALLWEVFTGAVLWIAIPSGAGPFQHGRFGGIPAHDRQFLFLSRSDWLDLHDWGAVTLVALILLHVALHWRWLWRQTKRLLVGSR